MNKGMMFALGLAFAGAANASTDFTFAAATDGTYFCSNYCVGFTSSDPTEVVTFVNVQYYSGTTYRVTFTVDGVTYQGYGGNGVQFTALSGTGGYALATVNWNSRTTCTHSGRAQHCTTWNYATGGAISL